MPASVVLALVAPVSVPLPGPVRLVRSGRGCPACLDSYCFNPAECLHFLMVNVWADCDQCDGSGWSEEGSLSLFCEGCAGSGLVEYWPYSLPAGGVSDRAKARHAGHVVRLRTRVASVAVAA
ncbi:hypothetical protein [Streptomyces sp. NBC_01508]|uniref:hypothetical protein n=1 Tax=Streptomyces sp. NBC_01508 TaxID=2903888 RepID=UPI00386EB6B3